jgi:hypothetical protein
MGACNLGLALNQLVLSNKDIIIGGKVKHGALIMTLNDNANDSMTGKNFPP